MLRLSSTSQSQKPTRRRLLIGLDQDSVIVPSESLELEKSDTFDARARTTRGSTNTIRPKPLYDQRVHPMDKDRQPWRWNNYLKRQGLSPVPESETYRRKQRLSLHNTSDEDGSSTSLELSDNASDGNADITSTSGGNDDDGREGEDDGGMKPDSSGNSKRGRKKGHKSPQRYFLRGHELDPRATRRSGRLQKQEILRPIYNAHVHPNDEDIPHYRGLGMKRKRDEEKRAKQELCKRNKKSRNKLGTEHPENSDTHLPTNDIRTQEEAIQDSSSTVQNDSQGASRKDPHVWESRHAL